MAELSTVDDYELVNCIATGNVTQVWEVRQVSTGGQQFAMKLLLPESLTDSDQVRALKHEAAVGKSVDHPNLIKVYDVRVSKKHGYFIMEYFRAGNLKSMLRADLPGAQMRLRKMMECVSQALAHMHDKGWVHRDIKPDNVLLNKGAEVRVIDFSLAQKGAGALKQMLGGSKRQVIQGTRTYIAPEMVRRDAITFSADVYSLGITMYEVLCGRPPFIQSNPNDLLMAHIRQVPEKPSGYNPNVTAEADDLVMRMLAKKPKERIQSMQEVFAAVRSLKLFKEDPAEHSKALSDKANSFQKTSLDRRIDSRADAGLSSDERVALTAERKRRDQVTAAKTKARATAAAKEAKGGPAPASPPPMPAAMPPGYGPPGYPMPAPGYPMPMPGMPAFMPGAMMPQPMMPPPMMPGQFMPGQPMHMPGQYPPQPMPPGYPVPMQPSPALPQGGGQPGGGAPAAPQPLAGPGPAAPAQQPATAPKPRPAAAPVKPPAEEELPTMDELPDVM